MYIYIIEYDGRVSSEGYDTLGKAIDHLFNQGYKQDFGLCFYLGRSIAKIFDVRIV